VPRYSPCHCHAYLLTCCAAQFILQAHATLAASGSGSNADVRFELRTRHTYTACPDCIRAQHITDDPAAAAAAPSPATIVASAGTHAAAATTATAAGFGGQTKQQLALLAAAAAAGVVVKHEVPVAGARMAGGIDATAAVGPALSPDAPLAVSTAAAQGLTQQQQQQTQQQQPGSANAVGSAAAAGAAGGGAASPQKPAVVVRGEVVCPVHTQAVYRYSVSETTDDFCKVRAVQCLAAVRYWAVQSSVEMLHACMLRAACCLERAIF
jgi:hypothetical protein